MLSRTMLKKSLTTILAATLLLAAVALLTPPVPAAAEAPRALHAVEGSGPTPVGLHGLLAGVWQDLLGVISAATCNADDDCAPDACFPEFCPCDPDPCAQDACNPEACTGGGDGDGNGGRFDPNG
jgi:hypothetical protein